MIGYYYIMEVPISRERLQNYRLKEAALAETKKRVLKEIQKICNHIERTILTTDERKYVYRITEVVKYGELMSQNSQVKLVNHVGFLKELLVGIKQAFPDSNIVLDPLETYIIIDWS